MPKFEASHRGVAEPACKREEERRDQASASLEFSAFVEPTAFVAELVRREIKLSRQRQALCAARGE
jgi:hypothetical protein